MLIATPAGQIQQRAAATTADYARCRFFSRAPMLAFSLPTPPLMAAGISPY